MLSNIIIRSTAAFGGTPFRLNKCTALGSAGKGANAWMNNYSPNNVKKIVIGSGITSIGRACGETGYLRNAG